QQILTYAREVVSERTQKGGESAATQPPRSPYPSVDEKFAREKFREEAEAVSPYPKMDLKYAREAAYHPTWQAGPSAPYGPEKSLPNERPKPSVSKGKIYLHANERGLVKIGTTKRSSEGRRRGYVKAHRLVGNYRLVKEWVELESYKVIEAEIHRQLAPYRVTHNMRELYRMEVAEALLLVEQAIAVYKR
ncbi:MAG: GIY-YIG nuclease family protein, partial [Enhydrobacter sp.]|nr:GIY-YIG nuclease family protein [Enhydrobacter sp.]